MRDRTPIGCKECGHAYGARVVQDEVVLETDDGKCACGNDVFVVLQGTTEIPAATGE